MEHIFSTPVYRIQIRLSRRKSESSHFARRPEAAANRYRLPQLDAISEGLAESFAKRAWNPITHQSAPDRYRRGLELCAGSWRKLHFVTLAYQDDCFGVFYVARLRDALRRHPGALFAFCDYSEHTPFGPRRINTNLRIKRALRHRAFGSEECIAVITAKKVRPIGRQVNPICCPSVMLDRSVLPDFRFPDGLQSNLDWMAWLELARRPGGFVYVRENLISKGVHSASETTAAIANSVRDREDRALFEILWPRLLAAALSPSFR